MSQYQPAAATIFASDFNGGEALTVGAITSLEIRNKTDTAVDRSHPSGDRIRTLQGQVPEIILKTKSVKTWLSLTGITGYPIASGGYVALWAIDSQTGEVLRYMIEKALIVADELSLTKAGEFELTVRIHPLTGNSTATPIYVSISDEPVPQPVISDEEYWNAACRVGGVPLQGFESFSIDFGAELTDKYAAAGNVWPDSLAVRAVHPKITLALYAPDELQTDGDLFPVTGSQATHANTKLQLFRARKADRDPVHIAITVNGMITVPIIFKGKPLTEEDDEGATFTLQIDALPDDAGNDPLEIDLAAVYDPLAE